MKSTLQKARSLVCLFLIMTILVACAPAEPSGSNSELPYHPRADTWLEVLGTPDAPDFMAGTSVVSGNNGGYIVAAGFTPGLANDVGLLWVGSDGQVQAARLTSNRVHSGSMPVEFFGNTLFVKALSLGGNKLSLTFDNVWLPEAGTDPTIPGWQMVLGAGDQYGLAVTDQVRAGKSFFLRLAVWDSQTAHLGLLKVTPGGTMTVAVEYPAVRVDRAGKLFMTTKGKLLTAGYIRSEDGSERAVVLWLNQDGSLNRSVTVEMEPYKLHQDAPYAHSGGFQDLEQLPNGDIILVQNFQICSIECPGSGALITRLTPAGVEVWTVGLHALGIGGETFIRDIRQEGNQLRLVGGSSLYLEPGSDYIHRNVLMASLDLASGKPTWLRSLGPVKYSGSSNEFKTDYANALLLTGDGRMLLTGTTDSFGSGQVWSGGPYYQHFDLLLGMASTGYGGIQGASGVMWSPDLMDKYKVWADKKAIKLVRQCPECTMQVLNDLSLTSIVYKVEALMLEQRDLTDGFPPYLKDLSLKVSDYGRYLVSNGTFFTDLATDIDYDGLDQSWENVALEHVKPLI